MKQTASIIRFVLLAALLFSSVFSPGQAGAALKPDAGIIYVGLDGSCGGKLPCYDSVQDAVEAAADGDSIRIAEGHYTGVLTHTTHAELVFINDKSLTLTGGYTSAYTDPPDPVAHPTILDAGLTGRVIYIDATSPRTLTLSGLEITRGRVTGTEDGGGIYSNFSASVRLTIFNSKIYNNSAGGNGGGISHNNLLIYNSKIYFNKSTGNGGGVASDLLYFQNVEVYGNHSGGMGGGVYNYSNSGEIYNSSFHDNSAGTDGGGLYLDILYQPHLEGTNITNNRATRDGGGLFMNALGEPTIIDITVSKNQAGQDGGGVFDQAPDMNTQISNSLIADNKATRNGGGIKFTGSASFINLAIIRNDAGSSGSGVYTPSGNANFRYSTFSGNTGAEAVFGTPILYNVIIANQEVGVVSESSMSEIYHVLWSNVITKTAGLFPVNVVDEHTGDPKFQLDGYHIQAGSAAVDRGVATEPPVKDDIDGKIRPVGSATDLGADELDNFIRVNPGVTSTFSITDTSGMTVTAQVPPGATSQPITLTLTPVVTSTELIQLGNKYAGHAFELSAPCQYNPVAIFLPVLLQKTAVKSNLSDLARRAIATAASQSAPGQYGAWSCSYSFLKPITITVYYKDSDVIGLDENTLTLDFWNGSQWIDGATTCTPNSTYTRNTTLNFIQLQICHLSEWSLDG